MMNPDARPAADCDELRELLPAYAAGLVDAEERELFENGLQDCPELMPELQEYADFTDALLFSMPPTAAPSHILENLMRLTAPTSTAAALPIEDALPVVSTPPASPAPTRQNPFVAFFKPTLRLRPALAAAVLALLVMSNVYWFYQAQQAVSAPETILVNFAPFDDSAQRVNFEGGDIAWSRTNAAETWLVVFSAEILEPLPDGIYQLWLVRQDEAPISAGIFNADESGRSTLIFEVSQPIGEFDRLGVTIEPTGGSPAPTGQAVFSGDL